MVVVVSSADPAVKTTGPDLAGLNPFAGLLRFR